MNQSVIQNLLVLGSFNLHNATAAEIAAFANGVQFMLNNGRPAVIKDGVTEETAFMSDLTDFLTAAQIEQNINNAIAEVEGALRFAGFFTVTAGAMPTAADDTLDNGVLQAGDMWVITGADEATIDLTGIDYRGAQDVTSGSLTVTRGDKLIYKGLNASNEPIWAHADDPFFDTLATTTQEGIVKLLDASAVGQPVDGALNDAVVTYEGMVALQALIENGYTTAIAAAETAAAVNRYVVSTTYPQQLVTQLATLSGGVIDVTAPTLPENPTIAQRNQYLVDLANTTFTAFQQLDAVVGDLASEMTNRLKISDSRNRVNAKMVGTPIESGDNTVNVYSVEHDGNGVLAFAGYTGTATISNPDTDEVFGLENAAGEFIAYGRVTATGTSLRFESATDTPFDADTEVLFAAGGRIRTLELVTAVEEAFSVDNIDKHLKQTLDGNETNAGASVAAIKAAIDEVNAATGDFVKYQSDNEQVIESDVQIGLLSALAFIIPSGNYVADALEIDIDGVGIEQFVGEFENDDVVLLSYVDDNGVSISTTGTVSGVVEGGSNVFINGDFSGWLTTGLENGAVDIEVARDGSPRDMRVTGVNIVDNLPQTLSNNEFNQAPSVLAVKLTTDALSDVDAILQSQINDLSINAGGEYVYEIAAADWVQDGDYFVKTIAAPVLTETAGDRQYSHGSIEVEINGNLAILSPEWADLSTRLSFDIRLPFAPTATKVYSSLVPGELVG